MSEGRCQLPQTVYAVSVVAVRKAAPGNIRHAAVMFAISGIEPLTKAEAEDRGAAKFFEELTKKPENGAAVDWQLIGACASWITQSAG